MQLCNLGSLAAIFALMIICSALDWAAVDHKLNQLISDKQFSGCVLGVYAKDSLIYKQAYGTMYPKWGLYAPPITSEMVFDINYLTQVIGVNSMLMMLFDQNNISLSFRVSRYLPEFDNNDKRYITIRNLLTHNSGLPPTVNESFGSTPSQLLHKIYTLKPQFKQGTRFQYSELGYVILGQLICKIMNSTLDQAMLSILVQSGMRDVKYLPTDNPQLIVPGGYDLGVTKGTSLNKISHFLGSVAGNAGLFAKVDDLGTYMQLMLNQGKMPYCTRIFSEEVINLFTTTVQEKYENTRAFGWDTVTSENCPCGNKFGRNSFGLADPTGSYVWADKDKGVAIVLLANGQYPFGTADKSQVQGELSDTIMEALGY